MIILRPALQDGEDVIAKFPQLFGELLGISNARTNARRSVEEAISYASEVARRGGSVAVIAPPGYGKTIQAARILSLEQRFLYAARTHLELDLFLSYHRGFGGLPTVRAAGREAVCYKRQEGDPVPFEKFCWLMRSSGRCDEEVRSDRVRTAYKAQMQGLEAVRAEAERIGACLYPSLRIVASKSPRLALTYSYAISARDVVERERLRIFDEYHTIASLYSEAFIELTPARVEELAKMVRSYAREKGFEELYRASYLLRRARSPSELSAASNEILGTLGGDSPPFTEILSHIASSCPKKCFQLGSTVYVARGPYPFTDIPGSIYLSSTPMPVLKKSEVISIDLPSPIARVEVITGLSTEYRARGEELYSELARAVSDIVRSHRGRAFIVYQSREVMRGVSPRIIEDKHRIIEDIAGGRLTEGVEVKHSLMILVGAPYPSEGPEVEALTRLAGVNGYEEVARARALQAIGRAVRAGARIVAIDSRFPKLLSSIPWIEIFQYPPH